MDLGYGVGETRVVSVAGGRKLRCCGSIRGDIYGLGICYTGKDVVGMGGDEWMEKAG